MNTIKDKVNYIFNECTNTEEFKQIQERTLRMLKREPQKQSKRKYKDITVNYYRDINGSWVASFEIKQNDFIYEVKGRKKQTKLLNKDLFNAFPEVTFCNNIPAKNTTDNVGIRLFGVATDLWCPLQYTPKNFEQRLKKTIEKVVLKGYSPQDIINAIKINDYISFGQLEKKIIQIIDFIIDKTTPQEFKKFKCSICGAIRTVYVAYKYENNNKICGDCKKKIKNGLIDKTLPKKGEVRQHKDKTNNRIYTTCHVCGIRTKKLSSHVRTHKMTLQQYQDKYKLTDLQMKFTQRAFIRISRKSMKSGGRLNKHYDKIKHILKEENKRNLESLKGGNN